MKAALLALLLCSCGGETYPVIQTVQLQPDSRKPPIDAPWQRWLDELPTGQRELGAFVVLLFTMGNYDERRHED